MSKSASLRRMFLVFVYMIIFVFSVYSIIQIRFFYFSEKPMDYYGNFSLFFVTAPMQHEQFILTKLSLFALTGALSFILMLTNYFFYQNPHHDHYSQLDREISQIRKKSAV